MAIRKITGASDSKKPIIDESAKTFAQRGETYRQMKRYPEALADFNRSIDDPLTGRYLGCEQVDELFAIFNQIVDGGSHEAKEYIVQGDKVVVCGEERIQFKNNGRNVQSSFVYVITLREGKIVQWRVIYGYP